MPRLLLVDDNPSIHRIAESLLAGSSVELVCVDSAEAALAKLGAESFDIALIDTVMPGMDGWQLLDRIRATPATEDLPVAMMAGVLDAVDQGRLDGSAIQGFLKKPIELRDLNDRVTAILASSTRSSAYSTVPGAKLEGWQAAGERDVSMFDVPAFPPEEAAPAEPEAESDLLILGPEDLLHEEEPEPTPAVVPAIPAHDAPTHDLVLEELDMDHLHALPHAEEPAAAMEGAAPDDLGLGELGELPEPAPALPPIHSVDLSLVDPAQHMEAPAEPMHEVLPEPVHEPTPKPIAEVVPMAAAAIALPAMLAAPEPAPAPPPPAPAPVLPVALPAASGAPADADALVRAIASDPALMDALVKALVAHAGDKVLREVAWELMPELASKLKP
jgi:CheY-like chemotaxis protein